MTNSPQVATAAVPADALADEESLYQATIQALDAPEKETSTLRKAALLIGTLALSVAAFLWLGFPLLFLLILIGVLLFHELGHYLGMQLFGYRDVRMFFIPFFGAAVSGRKYAAPVWQEATMLLLGPLPGLALAVALNWLYEPAPRTELYVLVWMLAYVNAFNLVPVTPLDGGRLVNLLFFARQPYLAAGFQLLAGGALVTYAWLNASWVLGILGVLMLLGVSHTYSEARQGERLRAENLELPDGIERLSDTQRRLLFARAVPRVAQDQRNAASLAAQFRAVYEHIMARRPSFLTTVVFVALYLAGFGAYIVVAYGEQPLVVAQAADRRALSESLRRKDDEALAEYRKALAIREAYAAKHPASVEGQHAISISYLNLALAFRVPAAQRLDYLEKAVAIREKLVERRPSTVKWQYELSRAHKALAGHYTDSRPEQALVHVGKAIALQEAAIAKDWRGRLGDWWSYERDPQRERTELGELHTRAGGLLVRMGQPREAVQHYRTSLAIDEKDSAPRILVALSHERLGEALAAAGDRTEAIEHLRTAATLYQQEAEAGASYKAEATSAMGNVAHALAPMLLDLGRESEALDLYRTALAVHEKFAADQERKETSEKGKPGSATAWALDSASKQALFARDFAKALAAAERSLSLAPGNRQVEAYRAHALMLLDRADDAKAAYLAHKGQPAAAGKTWAQVVSEGFASLKRAGLTHPMMAEVEKLLGL